MNSCPVLGKAPALPLALSALQLVQRVQVGLGRQARGIGISPSPPDRCFPANCSGETMDVILGAPPLAGSTSTGLFARQIARDLVTITAGVTGITPVTPPPGGGSQP